MVVAAVAMLATGCTSGSSGPPVTSSATSAITSASPTPSILAPTLPAGATAHDAAGAQEFAKYWFDVVNYTFTTRDTTLFRSLALPECRFCADFASRVDRRKAEGSTYEGGLFTPRIVVAPGPEADGRVLVDVRVDISASRIRLPDGKATEQAAGTKDYPMAVELRPSTTGWKVGGVAK